MIFKKLSVKEITQFFLEGESPTLIEDPVFFYKYYCKTQ